MPALMVLCCCCTHFYGLGSAVQTCPLLIHGAAASLAGQNSAEGQGVMNGLPRSSLSSLCPVLPGGPLCLAGGHVSHWTVLFVTSSWHTQVLQKRPGNGSNSGFLPYTLVVLESRTGCYIALIVQCTVYFRSIETFKQDKHLETTPGPQGCLIFQNSCYIKKVSISKHI